MKMMTKHAAFAATLRPSPARRPTAPFAAPPGSMFSASPGALGPPPPRSRNFRLALSPDGRVFAMTGMP